MINFSVFSDFLSFLFMGLLILIVSWLGYNVFISLYGYKTYRVSKKRYGNKYWNLAKISIIIPAKNEAKVISRLLDSILNQDYPRNMLEVIVVDGNSSDGTYEIVRKYMNKYKFIRVIREDNPCGKPHGLNQGLKHAKGDLIGIFDADSILPNNLFRKVSEYFNDDGIIAVQGKLISINEGQNILTRLVALEEKTWYNLVMKGRERLGLFVPLTGNCFFIRRDTLLDLGGFKEDELAEDLELSLRLYKKGYRVKYIDEIFSYQEAPSKLESLITQRTRWYRGYIKNLIKYGSITKLNFLKGLDVELLLSGPIILTLSLIGYLSIFIGLFIPEIFIFAMPIAVLINLLTLITLIIIFLLNRPITISKIIIGLSIYLYWILEAFIAAKSLFEELFRRPYKWVKTEKLGIASQI